MQRSANGLLLTSVRNVQQRFAFSMVAPPMPLMRQHSRPAQTLTVSLWAELPSSQSLLILLLPSALPSDRLTVPGGIIDHCFPLERPILLSVNDSLYLPEWWHSAFCGK